MKTATLTNGKRRSGGYHVKDNLQFLLMVLPTLVLLLLFHYLPMFGVVIAFQDFSPAKGFFGSEWVGLKNFEFFFKSQDAGRVIGNTVAYALTFLAMDNVLAIGLSLMFYCLKSNVCVKVYNTVMILPRFLSMVIISFIVLAMLNVRSGVINQGLVALGLKKVQWYSKPQYWPYILTFVHEWAGVGMGCILYYATLMGVDEGLFEAAMLDGANRRQQLWYVAIPHLVPVIMIKLILGMGSIFQGDFGLFYQVPRNIGLLYKTTDVINTYVFRAMMGGDLEKSAAIGLFQSLVGMVMVILTNLIVRRISPEQSLF